MEKYADSISPRDQADCEDAALLNTPSIKQDSQRRKTYLYLTLANLFLFTLSMLSLLCATVSQKDPTTSSTANLMNHFGIFSPAMHQVHYSRVKFSLPHPPNSSLYTGTSDAVDAAWMNIAHLPDQLVSAADFPRLHKPATAMSVTDPATGQTGYRVGLEVFHQLHCLNLLRMATYPEHYARLAWSDTNDEPGKVRAHLDHCVEILRWNLMCLADVNVFTFQPVEGREGYWPDYESERVCRDFEHIRDWANANAMPEADV